VYPHGLSSIAICTLPPEMCHCFIVRTPHLLERDRSDLFKDDDLVEFLDAGADMLDVLVKCGAFSSKGQARKNWRGPVEISWGWSEFMTSKNKNGKLVFAWKPALYEGEV
jgi:hypothetical protein